MSVKSGQAVTVLFAVANGTTGAATDATGTPVGTLYVNGTANGATVTVTNITTGVYKAALTLPALSAGDVVSLRIAATVATVAGEGIVWQEVADTKRVSDLNDLGGTAQSGDAYARLGAPAGASVSADIANLPTVAEFEARTLPSADYTVVSDLPSVPSAADNATAAAAAILATPANLLLTDASGRVEISGTKNTLDSLSGADGDTLKTLSDQIDGVGAGAGLSAQEVRDALKLAPTAGAAADGSIDDLLTDMPAAIAAISAGMGSGTGTYTDTVTDGTNPLDGVRVQLSTDSAKANPVYQAYTDALGVFLMYPDPGTYYVWFEKAGYDFSAVNGTEVTVT